MTIEVDTYSNRYGSEMSICSAGANYGGIIGIQVYSSGGILKRELNFNTSEYKFNNLVTDVGLNYLGSNSLSAEAAATYCRFGTGTLPPSVDQTSLISPTGSTATKIRIVSYGNSGAAPWYNYTIGEWVFNPGMVSGNLTEIAFFANHLQTTMFSRALIKDELGNPTTLTILPDEYVYVTYEIRAYVGDLADIPAEIELGGETYGLNVRKFKINQELNSIFSPRNTPYARYCQYVYASSEQAGLTGDVPYTAREAMGGAGTFQPYVNNSLKRSFVTTSSPAQANIVGGFNQIMVNGSSAFGGFTIFFDKMVPKDMDKTMSFTITTSWSRYTVP